MFPGVDTVSTTEDRSDRSRARPGAVEPPSRSARHVGVPGRASVAVRLDGVALVTIDRQEALNALSFDLLDELADALERLDADDACRAIVLTGAGTRAFAAGADIKELATPDADHLTVEDRFAVWDRIGAIRTPLDRRGPRLRPGRRLRAGDELRHDRRRRGRPVRPARDQARGHARRRRHPAADAGDRQGEGDGADPHRPDDAAPRKPRRPGLVTKVVPAEATLDAALELAARIAAQPPLAVLAAKEAILRAEELSLSAGLDFERRAFFLLFASDDQTEGMAAFSEKRPPRWTGR